MYRQKLMCFPHTDFQTACPWVVHYLRWEQKSIWTFWKQRSSSPVRTPGMDTWAPYMHDVFCVWTGSVLGIQSFLQDLNHVDPSVEFTLEIEGSSLDFLDLQIELVDSQNVLVLKFGIFRKSTFTGVSIHNTSLHYAQPPSINSAINRLLAIPLSQKSEKREIQAITSIAQINGFHLVRRRRLRNLLRSS